MYSQANRYLASSCDCTRDAADSFMSFMLKDTTPVSSCFFNDASGGIAVSCRNLVTTLSIISSKSPRDKGLSLDCGVDELMSITGCDTGICCTIFASFSSVSPISGISLPERNSTSKAYSASPATMTIKKKTLALNSDSPFDKIEWRMVSAEKISTAITNTSNHG